MFRILGRKDKTEAGVRATRERWFGKVVGLFSGPRLGEQVWEQLEESLIGSDVGVELALHLVGVIKKRAVQERIDEPKAVLGLLKQEMEKLLDVGGGSWLADNDRAGVPKPLVVVMMGVNGVGKTTSIAKLAYHLVSSGDRVLLAAADTFRAAATEQLQVWGQRVGVEVISHKEGGDPGAVAFDAFQAARARDVDVLIIDTAGRLHTKSNLMEELRKVVRVLSRLDGSAPHEALLVMDATTGQNGLSQARSFAQAVPCTGIFLAKMDGTAKGGIVFSICRELNIPVLFIGTGEGQEDMAPFDRHEFVEALFS